MGKIITIINQKGGVGKTTTALSFGAGLGLKKKKVLLIDLDPQTNLSFVFNAGEVKTTTICDVLLHKANILDSINHTKNYDFITSHSDLALADSMLTKTGKEYILSEVLETIKSNYDYIIIDTPPALGVLTINSLSASDECIITSQADIFSIQGITQLYETITAIKKYCNSKLIIAGILITRFNSRTILSKDMLEVLKDFAEKINTKIYNTKIRECIAIKESQAMQTDIFTYSKGSNASKDYNDFIKEYMTNEKRG